MKEELAKTAEALLLDIAQDPVNWRAWEDRLRQVIAACGEVRMALPPQLRVYAEWLHQDDLEDQFENLPV